jgi:PPOX class probable F420-dependent enzyme
MTKRSIDELGDFLDLPYTAVLATHWADGTVLLSPIWHEWRDGGFNLGVPENDVKLKHIARDPRVTLCVYEQSWPSRSLEVRGIATVTMEGREELSRRLSVRYLGPVKGNEYANRVGSGVVVRIEPGIIRAWDFVDETSPEPDTASRLIPLVVIDAEADSGDAAAAVVE